MGWSRLRDVRRLAQEASGRAGGVVDVLINNAGATRSHREVTEDGIETAFAVNVVAPFCLTHWLMPALTASEQARVINITGGIPRGRSTSTTCRARRPMSGCRSTTRPSWRRWR